MAQFRYRAYARDKPSEIVTDVVEATSAAEAANILSRSGMQAVDIQPVTDKRSVDFSALNTALQGVKAQELADFTSMLSTMTRAGMTILQSLEVCERGAKNPVLKRAIAAVTADVHQGLSPAEAMAKHPRVFDPLYISLVSAGETSGRLDHSLDRLADALTKRAEMRREIRSAMVYPVLVIVMSIAVFLAMMYFVVPSFESMFKENGQKLPFLTRQLLFLSGLVKNPAFIVLLVVGVPSGIYGFRRYIKTEGGRMWWGAFKLSAPRIGPLTQKIVTARLFRTLATLYEAGVPILTALEISAPTADNAPVEACLELVVEDIKNGISIAASIHRQDFLPDMADAMLMAGQEAGNVEQMLSKVAETYESEVATAIKSIKSLVEPVMIMLIGAIVGVTVVGLYQPMFQVYNQIK